MHEAIILNYFFLLFTEIIRPLFYSKIKTKKNEDSMFMNIQFFCSERNKQIVGWNFEKKKKTTQYNCFINNNNNNMAFCFFFDAILTKNMYR